MGSTVSIQKAGVKHAFRVTDTIDGPKVIRAHLCFINNDPISVSNICQLLHVQVVEHGCAW